MKIIPRPPPSELVQFARLFCQDFDLVFPGLDVVQAARTHLEILRPERSVVLRRELEAFLALHAEMPSGVLGTFWRILGAVHWPRGIDTRLTLETFIGILDARQPRRRRL
jgi:hypothetical protein